MLRTIDIGTLITCACVVDSDLIRIVSVMACTLSAFSLGMDFAEQE